MGRIVGAEGASAESQPRLLVDQSRLAPLDVSIIGALAICSSSYAALRSCWGDDGRINYGFCWCPDVHRDLRFAATG